MFTGPLVRGPRVFLFSLLPRDKSAIPRLSIPRLLPVQAVSITDSYRITMTVIITKKEIILLDIGSHDEVYK